MPHTGSPISSASTDTDARPATGGASVFDRLEPLLPQVQKPIQYVGGELNATPQEWGADEATARWAMPSEVPRIRIGPSNASTYP